MRQLLIWLFTRSKETQSGNVPQNQAGKRLLTRCFERQELDYLERQLSFQKAVAEMITLTDFEKVAALGQHLLAERDRVHSKQNDHDSRLQA